MRSNRTNYTLDQVCKRIYSGGTPSTACPEFWGGDINWLSSGETGQKYIKETVKKITFLGVTKSATKLAKKGCTVVASAGQGFTRGQASYLMIDTYVNQSVIVFEPIEDLVLSRYLYFNLDNRYEEFRLLSDGTSTRGGLSGWIVKRMEIALPSIDEQKKVVAILKRLDEKIELNNAINNNLQQQAETLFQAWFINNPDNMSWRQGVFENLIDAVHSGDWGKDTPIGSYTQQVFCIRGADIPSFKCGERGKMPTRYIQVKNLATKKLCHGDIVVEISGGSPTQSTGRAAPIIQSLIERYDGDMVCTNFCKALTPKPHSSLFVYYYWQYLYDKGVFFTYENGTTGIKNLDVAGILENERIIIPPTDMIEQFDDICSKIWDKIASNGLESEQLSSLRDSLLPKLMSGEIDVSDIEI